MVGPWASEAGARASIQPSKALCILEQAPRILPVRRSLWPAQEEKRPWSDISYPLRNLPVRAFDSRAQRFSTLLARRRSSCPPPSPSLVRAHPIGRYQALRDSAPCLSRAATPPEGHQSGARKVRIWEHHPQPTIPPPRFNRQAESRRQPVITQ